MNGGEAGMGSVFQLWKEGRNRWSLDKGWMFKGWEGKEVRKQGEAVQGNHAFQPHGFYGLVCTWENRDSVNDWLQWDYCLSRAAKDCIILVSLAAAASDPPFPLATLFPIFFYLTHSHPVYNWDGTAWKCLNPLTHTHTHTKPSSSPIFQWRHIGLFKGLATQDFQSHEWAIWQLRKCPYEDFSELSHRGWWGLSHSSWYYFRLWYHI